MPARVPMEVRRDIVHLSLQGVLQQTICSITGRSMTAVNRIIQAYRDEDGRLLDAVRWADVDARQRRSTS